MTMASGSVLNGTGTGDYSALLQPLTINRLQIRNRVLMTGHVTDFAVDNLPSDQHVAYYEERARGGIGLIVMAFPAVHPTSRNSRMDVNGWTDDMIPGLAKIADAVHAHGAKMFVQLGHSGRQQTSLWTEREVWAPSAVPCPVAGEMPKEMELEDIAEIIQAHAEAAVRVKESGMDGVEIHSGYGGYLLSSFLSPYMNFRTDQYGGSFENRLRLTLEVADAVRAAVGPDFVVGLQTQGADFSPDGMEEDEGRRAAKILAETGKLDYLTVKASTYGSDGQNVPDMQHPREMWLPLAQGIRAVTGSVPVFAVGRLNDARRANEVVANGSVDMVAMTRQHIADPETVNKLSEGRADDVNWCIAINQGCLDKLAAGHHVTCSVNPAAGYERTLGIGSLIEAPGGGRVVVIGAGPAGLKAAETAARRGFDVTVFEQRDELGGQLRFAASIPGRTDIMPAIDYLAIQTKKLGVEFRMGEKATRKAVLDLEPSHVVVATGARPAKQLIGNASHGINDVPGLDRANVITTLDLLEHGVQVGARVLIVDDGEGSWKSIASAFWLDGEGKDVTLVTPHPYVGAKLGMYTQHKLISRLFASGVDARPFTLVTSIDDEGVHVIEKGKPGLIAGIDTIILAGWHESASELYFMLKGAVASVHRIGDAVAPRGLIDAIREGDRLARSF